jgi:hypothetical protein
MIMKSKLLHSVAGVTLSLGMGVATAGPVPTSDILGSSHYQAMSSQQMASVTGETGKKRGIRIVNRNTNTNTNTNTVCLAICAGGDINVLSPPV